MTNDITVLEGAEFHIEQAYLAQDNGIIRMANDLLEDPAAPKGQALLDWLDSWEGITAAQRTASERGIKFGSIGGPARAISRLIVKRWDSR